MLPIVFIPGLLCDERLWREQNEALAELTCCLTADITLEDSLSAMATRLLADAPPRFALVALSMGGYVAFEMIRQAHERIGALALFDTTAAPDSPARASERAAVLKSLTTGRFSGVTSQLLPRLIDEQHVAGPVGAELRAMAQRVGAEALVRQQTAIMNRSDSRPMLATLNMPTLIAVGDGDQLTPPSDAIAMFRAIRHPRFHLFHRCGHLPALEQPAETTRVLKDWLAGPASGAG